MLEFARIIGERALVLKEFKINREGPEYVHICARKSGLIAWFLNLIGIDATTTFRVFEDRVEFVKGSLSGNLQTIMPLRSLSITSCGYTKPFILILFGFMALVYSIINKFMNPDSPMWLIYIVVAIVFFVIYFLNKALLITVVSHSSWPASVCFKRSIIENVGVDYEQAQEVIRIINYLTMRQASK